MPREDRVATILIAGPTDVREEASRAQNVVDELNRDLSSLLGVRLEAIAWQKDAVPGVGADPQDVVNQQLPDYDIFLGIMWARFGTPTLRYGSGTEEEFERALARHQEDPNAVKIMIYFKTTPLEPKRIDPSQLGKVAAFRERLPDRGILFQEFSTGEEFPDLLRKHLLKQLQTFSRPRSQQLRDDDAQPSAGAAAVDPGEQEAEEQIAEREDWGYIDFLDEAESQLLASAKIASRMGDTIRNFGGTLKRHTGVIERTAKQSKTTRKKMRGVFGKVATDMDLFTGKLRGDVPELRLTLAAGISAARDAIQALPSGSDNHSMRQRIDELSVLKEGLDGAVDGTTSFLRTVEDLPSLTKELNRAKRALVDVLTETVDVLVGGTVLLQTTIERGRGR